MKKKRNLLLMILFVSSISAFTQKTIHLTDESFKQFVFDYDKETEWVYKGSTPAIVDFYADWCGPCKRVAPILEQLAKEYGDKLVIYKVNTEKAREVSSAFGITSIPSILFIPAQGAPQMAKGALPKATLQAAIKDVLKVE